MQISRLRAGFFFSRIPKKILLGFFPDVIILVCLVRGGAVWQLVGLITRRSQVQILPPLPIMFGPDKAPRGPFLLPK